MGARLQRILFAQLQIQQRYFHVPVQVFRPWLEATGQGRPAKELITLYLMANTWKGWREQVLNKPAAGAKSRSAELLRRHADMLVDQWPVILPSIDFNHVNRLARLPGL
jgi:hypothetical protein